MEDYKFILVLHIGDTVTISQTRAGADDFVMRRRKSRHQVFGVVVDPLEYRGRVNRD